MKFKKILSVIGGALLIGSTMGIALANTYPTPFVQDGNADVAIVYGTGSAPSDLVAAGSISNNLKSVFDSFNVVIDSNKTQGDFSDSSGVIENEVFLGTELLNSLNGNMRAVFTDNQIPSLIDNKIRWDDGVSTKTSFNVHEEILVGNMNLLTTLDDKDLDGVALTNNKDLEYRYVFEDTLDTDLIGDDDADDLEITILGKPYVVEEFEDDSVTISSSNQEVKKIGETIVVEGVVLTIEDIFEDTVQVNGEFIREGRTGTVDGMKVQVESIAYHSSETLPSKVILKVGKEISTTYSNGDAYIGEDEDEPMWVWNIDQPGKAGGFIGVQYDHRQIDSDDNIVYVGESYTFPENYAAVTLEALTEVDYANFEVSFDDSKNLYEANNNNTKMYEDAKVLVMSGDAEDSFVINGFETDEVSLKYTLEAESYVNNDGVLTNVTNQDGVWNGTSIQWEGNTTSLVYLGNTTTVFDGVEVFYNDVDKDYSSTVRPRYAFTLNVTGNVGELVYEDTELDMTFDSISRTLTFGDLTVKLNPTGNFTHLGNESEDAESSELVLNGEEVGNEDEDIMGHYGLIVYNSESNSEEDEVVLGVPSEQVYAEVNVLGQGVALSEDVSQPQFGSIIVTDAEVNSVSDKNLIVVGGSCINSVAANLLGLSASTCGEAFTAATGIGTGQYLLKEYVSPYNSEKVALLVAGYNAEDTTAGVNSLFA